MRTLIDTSFRVLAFSTALAAATAQSWSPAPTGPTPRVGGAMAFVDSTRTFVLFGGSGTVYDDRTWIFDPDGAAGAGRWSSFRTSFNPSGIVSNAMAYDPKNDVVLMFGGTTVDGTFVGATLEFDPHARQWSVHVPTPRPGPRSHVAMAYDPTIERIVMFGGSTNTAALDETWLYDAATHTWAEVQAATRPSPRGAAHLATLGGVPTLVGGDSGGDETWQWLGAARTWRQVFPQQRPVARSGGMLVSTGSRLLLHGGTSGSIQSPENDVWAFDGVDWSLLQNAAPTSAVVYPAGAYDTSRQRALRVGGFATNFTVVDDAWSFDDQLPAATPFGAGCPAMGVRARLEASAPTVGANLTFRVSYLGNRSPTPVTVLNFGVSDRQFGSLALPFALGLAGRPDCRLHTSVDALVGVGPTGMAVDTLTIPVPSDPRLVDANLFAQAMVTQGATFGASNGLAVRLR